MGEREKALAEAKRRRMDRATERKKKRRPKCYHFVLLSETTAQATPFYRCANCRRTYRRMDVFPFLPGENAVLRNGTRCKIVCGWSARGGERRVLIEFADGKASVFPVSYVSRESGQKERGEKVSELTDLDEVVAYLQWMGGQRCFRANASDPIASYDPKCECSTCRARHILKGQFSLSPSRDADAIVEKCAEKADKAFALPIRGRAGDAIRALKGQFSLSPSRAPRLTGHDVCKVLEETEGADYDGLAEKFNELLASPSESV